MGFSTPVLTGYRVLVSAPTLHVDITDGSHRTLRNRCLLPPTMNALVRLPQDVLD